ncbi:hypothetical protein PanWU01x14_273010 [Parasponia andersonii]|uniref:Uncharacterized protein n=1 Tax=Parasponia andersonii TaxID=3476 RepID=A0A2P5B406_PARAD|nr:hypothetical protein PanWU01x14_273010 [Parasponia andersonii]
MVAGIVAGDGKTEMGQNGINGFFWRHRRQQQVARGGGSKWQPSGGSQMIGVADGGWRRSCGGAAERDPREERERDFWGERERGEEERGLVEQGHVAQPYRAVQFLKNCT